MGLEVLKTYRVFDRSEKVHVRNGVTQIRSHYVETKTLGRLVGHLDSVLQNGHWKLVWWITGEPESKVWMGLLRIQLLAHFLQSSHPRCGQVTVLKHYPGSVLDGCGDQLQCDRSLTLAKWKRIQLATTEALFLKQLNQNWSEIIINYRIF